MHVHIPSILYILRTREKKIYKPFEEKNYFKNITSVQRENKAKLHHEHRIII